jgi:poly [ADP-ribose] polymerase
VQALVRLILPNKDHSTTTSASLAVDRKFLTLGLSEATPLNHDSQEFKRLHRYFYPSHPGRTEANDLPEAGHTDIVIEDIVRISHTEELAGFGGVDLRNAKDSRRLLWHGSRTCNIAGIVTQGLRIAPPGVPDHGTRWRHGIYLTDE